MNKKNEIRNAKVNIGTDMYKRYIQGFNKGRKRSIFIYKYIYAM